MEFETLVTVRDIADAVGRSVYQVRYAIDSRGIEPVRRAGLVRLFDPSAIEVVRSALEKIGQRRRLVPSAV